MARTYSSRFFTAASLAGCGARSGLFVCIQVRVIDAFVPRTQEDRSGRFGDKQ